MFYFIVTGNLGRHVWAVGRWEAGVATFVGPGGRARQCGVGPRSCSPPGPQQAAWRPTGWTSLTWCVGALGAGEPSLPRKPYSWPCTVPWDSGATQAERGALGAPAGRRQEAGRAGSFTMWHSARWSGRHDEVPVLDGVGGVHGKWVGVGWAGRGELTRAGLSVGHAAGRLSPC